MSLDIYCPKALPVQSVFTCAFCAKISIEVDSRHATPLRTSLDRFTAAYRENGTSFSTTEASSLVNGFRESQFEETDIDVDGFLRQSEWSAQMIADERGTPQPSQRDLAAGVQRHPADLFLLGTVLLSMRSCRNGSQQNQSN